MTHLAALFVPFGSAWHHGGAGWWIAGVILFCVLLAGGIALLLRSLVRRSGRECPPHGESALEVLDRRFAEGQLSVEEYQSRRQILAPESHGR